VQGLGSERTVILSTHILPEVETICSRVIIMNRGRILAVDSPSSLEEHLRPHREIAVEVAGARDDVLRVLHAIDGVSGVAADAALPGAPTITYVVRCVHHRDVRREVAAAVAAAGFGLVELKPVVMTLEEIFLALTSRDRLGDEKAVTPPSPQVERVVASH
jgi:ABC-2 type transport system ATP-binding protein